MIPLVSIIFILHHEDDPIPYLSAYGLVSVLFNIFIFTLNLSLNRQMERKMLKSGANEIPLYFNLHRLLMGIIMVINMFFIGLGLIFGLGRVYEGTDYQSIALQYFFLSLPSVWF